MIFLFTLMGVGFILFATHLLSATHHRRDFNLYSPGFNPGAMLFFFFILGFILSEMTLLMHVWRGEFSPTWLGGVLVFMVFGFGSLIVGADITLRPRKSLYYKWTVIGLLYFSGFVFVITSLLPF